MNTQCHFTYGDLFYFCKSSKFNEFVDKLSKCHNEIIQTMQQYKYGLSRLFSCCIFDTWFLQSRHIISIIWFINTDNLSPNSGKNGNAKKNSLIHDCETAQYMYITFLDIVTIPLMKGTLQASKQSINNIINKDHCNYTLSPVVMARYTWIHSSVQFIT